MTEVKEALFSKLQSYDNVRMYIEKWQVEYNWNEDNFSIKNGENGKIDVLKTLQGMDSELLLRVAVDLGVDTPDFIPSVATFKNEIKSNYETAFQTFEKALKEVDEHPDIAIGLANSALESIFKEIAKDERLPGKNSTTGTLYDLAQNLLKSLDLYPDKKLPEEVRNIGSGLLKILKNIEDLRSTKTKLHGLTDSDYLVTDSLLAQFVVNSTTTIGIFLNNYYKNRFPPISQPGPSANDLPF